MIMNRSMKFFKKKKPTITSVNNSFNNEEQKLSVVINTIDDGLILVDPEKNIQLFNPSASKITGWELKDAMNINIDSVLKLVNDKNEPYSTENNPINKSLSLKQSVKDNEAYLVTLSNQIIPVNLSVSPVLNQNQISALIIDFRNVTTERAEEQKKVDFISTASHEMRTPVAAIEGYLSLALNEKVATIDQRARGYLEKAHSTVQHLGKLFQDLLTSSKAEDGRLVSHPSVINVVEFLEQTYSDLKFEADKKGLFSEFLIGSADKIDASVNNLNENRTIKPIYYVYADPDRLSEAITNLYDNAVKYTEEGKITIGVTANNNLVQCYIKDTGSGIPKEDIPHLFQKFYRVDNSATRTIGGTGLGLFITKKIIELYQGKIWVDSEINRGTTFYINLPRLSTEKAMNLKNNTISPTLN
jgi:PAS domain S-box-containing protein